VNFILDADVRSFFTEVSQSWVIRFLEHRIGDTRILRLVQKWLRAGVLEDGIVTIGFVANFAAWRTSRMIEGERSGGCQYGSG
jgi:hypothetical protein